MNIIYLYETSRQKEEFNEVVKEITNVHDIKYFSNFEKALNQIKNSNIDIIFINITNCKIKGMEMCTTLKKNDHSLYVVFIDENKNLLLDAFLANANGFIILPLTLDKIEHELNKVNSSILFQKQIFVKTFGYFDVFVNGDAVHFKNAKSKEFLALLIDKCGGIVTMDYTITYLWPDKNYDNNIKSRYRAMLKDLRETLREYGIYEIISEKRNSRSINRSKFICDYYGLLKGEKKYVERFDGRYMFDYSWAEETLSDINSLIK